MEIWKGIIIDTQDFSQVYEVSNFGRVRSLRDNHNRPRIKILKLSKSKGGYLKVNLYKEGNCFTYKIHRLVAQMFIPNPDNLPCINHKDENKSNNNTDNLEWCTYEYNNNYGTHNQRMSNTKINGRGSIPIVQLTKQGNLVRAYKSSMEAQRLGNFYTSNINCCCKHKLGYSTYKGYVWLYLSEYLDKYESQIE